MLRASTHGAPNWIDLSTPDPEAAARFYGDLFEWTIETSTSPMGTYRLARVGDRQVGGMMAPPPGQEDVPSAWTVMMYVADVDETVERVLEAKGAVLEPAFDLPDARIAIVADPSGAMFGVISGPPPEGTWLSEVHGTVCWVELLTRDPAAAEPFYAAVLGWKPETVDAGGTPYTTFWLEGERVAGMMPTPDTVPDEVPSYWGVYLAVADCEATAAEALERGGEVLVPPMNAGDMEFAVLTDPWDATFSIMRTDGEATR